VVVVDRLAELGSEAWMPLPRRLGDGLFELRLTLGTTARRITYRFTSAGSIVLPTTFRKQRNNERTEVARVRQVAADCARRYPRGGRDGELFPLAGSQEEPSRANS